MFLLTTAAAAALAMSLQADPNEQPTETAAQAEQQQQAEPEAEKITDSSHPDFVRCRRDPVIGSRAKFVKRCFTNREWERIAQAGNRGARSIVSQTFPGQFSENE